MGVGLAQSGSAFGRPADTAMERGEDPYEPPPSYTAGVPIPGRRQWMPDERRAELAWSAGGASSFHHPGSVELACSASPAAGTGGWHGSDWHEPELARDLQRFQIDDIFECEEVSELMPGPTLAELNAGDDLHELHLEQQGVAGAPPLAAAAVKSELPDWPGAAGGHEMHHHRPPPGRRGTLQALLTAGSWAPRGCSAGLAGRLSSSVPCGELQRPPSAGVMRRDEARGSASSLSGSVLSPGSYDSYADDGIDSHDDRDSDSDSDAGSHMGDAESPGSSLGRKERYFWQYNVQAKGPKGARLQLSPDMADPYHVRQAVDPVFSSNFQMEGIKHSGKARRGDGNDLTPSPRKLLHIRGDLEKLNRKIADMPPISELPFSVRPKSRKEKNMLASRVCRLKKKAQHEANKIQLSGLNDEHRRLSAALREMGHLLRARVIPGVSHVRPEEAGPMIEKLYRQATKGSVAGDLQEYVKHILVNCETGRSMSGESFFSHGEPG